MLALTSLLPPMAPCPYSEQWEIFPEKEASMSRRVVECTENSTRHVQASGGQDPALQELDFLPYQSPRLPAAQQMWRRQLLGSRTAILPIRLNCVHGLQSSKTGGGCYENTFLSSNRAVVPTTAVQCTYKRDRPCPKGSER